MEIELQEEEMNWILKGEQNIISLNGFCKA